MSMMTTEQIYKALLKHMGPQEWWPADTREEIILGAILVQNTNWNNAALSLRRLKEATNFEPRSILDLPIEELKILIRSSGFYNNKSKAISSLFNWLNQYQFDYCKINEVYGEHLRNELLKLHGIGSETADVLLVYIFERVEFIPDHYTRRLYRKLGYANTENYDKLKRHVELPSNFTNQDANEFHALLDNFGKNYFNGSIEQRYHFLDQYFTNMD